MLVPSSEDRSRFPTLNARQSEILALIAKGRTNKEIAKVIKLTERTVKWYVSQLLELVNAANRTELAVKYAELTSVTNHTGGVSD